MSISKIFNILFFPKPNPDVGGKTINKQSSGQGPNYGMYVLIAIVAVVVLAGINYAVSHPVTTQAQIPISPQAPLANPIPGGIDIPTGAMLITINGEDYYRFNNEMGDVSKKDYLAHKAEFDAKLNPTSSTISTKNINAQEKTQPLNNQWYEIKENRNREETFNFKGTKITIEVGPVSSNVMIPLDEDRKKLQNSEQNIIIKIKFRIKNTDKIFPTPISAYESSIMFNAMPGWQQIIVDKKTKPTEIEWQPEFGSQNKYNN